MIDTVIIQNYIIEALLLVLIGASWLHFSFHKKKANHEAELWIELSKTLKAAGEVHRANHLETMKALKGDSYAGQFGGMDIHTDPNIPPRTSVLFPWRKDT